MAETPIPRLPQEDRSTSAAGGGRLSSTAIRWQLAESGADLGGVAMSSRHALDASLRRPPMFEPESESLSSSLRLAGDAALCERLRATGCVGPDWQMVATTLYRKAMKTTGRLIVEGGMFIECAKKGRRIPRVDFTQWADADIKALAHDTVSDNMKLFRDVGILGGGWDHGESTSLYTYFVGGVILCHPNALARVLTQHRSWNHKVTFSDDLELFDTVDEREYRHGVPHCTEEMARLLDMITAPAQRFVVEQYFVYARSVAQIAVAVEDTEAAVRSRLARGKDAIRKHLEEGGR